jgi:DNA-binding NtrC family response regulator
MTSYPTPSNFSARPACANHVLVASPSSDVRQRVFNSLRSPALRFEHARGGAEALLCLESGSWQMVFLDRRLPDLNAEELSQTVRQRYPEIEVVLLDEEEGSESEGEANVHDSAPIGIPETWNAAPQEPAEEGILQERVLGDSGLRGVEAEENETDGLALAGGNAGQSMAEALPGMIGDSAVMQSVYRRARLLAPRNTTVLITGPTGCGKEVVARAIHHLSLRSARAFAVVNCAAIPETLLEAELFGYARGAFTGAMQAYGGRIQAAQGGTLFLDEIGEMPLSLQPKLLRFLEQKELQRLGSADVVRVDARILSATNAHLLSLVREGKFREDLYYRLCGFPIEIPALRERCEDIVQLAAHLILKYSERRPAPQLSLAALQKLKRHSWAGNIRELQNVIERALILAQGRNMIRPEHLMLGESAFVHAPAGAQ